MKCNIVKDLMPLYAEGLCSEETADEIREHLEDCPECKKLADCDLSVGKQPEPDKETAMKKVNRSFRIKKLIIRILAVILGAVLIVTGLLTVGQALRTPYLPSFETIISKHYAKRIADCITNGAYGGAILEMSYDYMENVGTEGKIRDDFFEQLEKKDAEALKKAWEGTYGNTKLKGYKLKSTYGDVIRGTEKAVMHIADLEFEDGRTQQICIVKNTDGLYKIFTTVQDTEEEKHLADTLLYLSLRNTWNTCGWTEKAIIRDTELNTNKDLLESYFISDGVTDKMNDLYSAGYKVTDSVFSLIYCTEDGSRFYYKVSVTAEDDKGSAVLNTKLYFDENGLYSPAPEDVKIISDGCGNDLTEKLSHFFG